MGVLRRSLRHERRTPGRSFRARRATFACMALAAVFVNTGALAAAQEASPEPMEYRLYVANESSDIVSRVVFRPGAGARPPVFAGRDGELALADARLEALGRGRRPGDLPVWIGFAE